MYSSQAGTCTANIQLGFSEQQQTPHMFTYYWLANISFCSLESQSGLWAESFPLALLRKSQIQENTGVTHVYTV